MTDAPELLPCPFCGGEAEFERIGDRRQSTIIACLECGCRLESGETFSHGGAWNTRADLSLAEMKRENKQLRGLLGQHCAKTVDAKKYVKVALENDLMRDLLRRIAEHVWEEDEPADGWIPEVGEGYVREMENFCSWAQEQTALAVRGNTKTRTDGERLDFLDECNARLNEHSGTTYGWKMVMNHNVNRLMIEGRHLAVNLHDSEAFGAPSCREAIDAEIERVRASKVRTPCGECHLHEGEICDICGAIAPREGQ